MSSISVEGATQAAPASALTKQRLKWLMYAGLAGTLALGAARYGYDWWSVGRFIESTDDAYAGGNVTPISPHVAGFVAQILAGDNEYVRAGQPLIRLDDRDFRAAVDRATAIVAARQATLASLADETVDAANDHPPGKGGSRRQDGAGGIRQARRPTVSRACADQPRDRGKTRRGRRR